MKKILLILGFLSLILLSSCCQNTYDTKEYIITDIISIDSSINGNLCLFNTTLGKYVSSCSYDIGDTIVKTYNYRCE